MHYESQQTDEQHCKDDTFSVPSSFQKVQSTQHETVSIIPTFIWTVHAKHCTDALSFHIHNVESRRK